MRRNLTLDDGHAATLLRLAERAHLQPGTLARSLFLTALDRTAEQEQQDPKPRDVVASLDGIEGACGRLESGRRAAAEGNVVPVVTVQDARTSTAR
ncbi:hypothetical protein ACVU7I_01890 [Patulibacter sp. S7RM1-6]